MRTTLEINDLSEEHRSQEGVRLCRTKRRGVRPRSTYRATQESVNNSTFSY